MPPTRLLIVDDDLAYGRLLGLLARAALPGAEVTFAHSGTEAIAQVGRGAIDLVLTDLHMPGTSGIDVARAARAAAPEAVVLVLSAGASEEDRERAVEAGAATCVQKPCSVAEFVSMIRSAFTGQRLEAV